VSCLWWEVRDEGAGRSRLVKPGKTGRGYVPPRTRPLRVLGRRGLPDRSTFLTGLGCDSLRAYPFVLWEISLEQLQHASNVELLSRLASKSVAEALLNRFGNLTNLAQASFAEMQQIRGVGQSKAAAIKSAFLLAQRLSRETYADSPVLDTPERVADLLREENRLYTVEHFQAVFLNTRRRLIAVQNICQGTLDRVLTSPRDVFAAAWPDERLPWSWCTITPRGIRPRAKRTSKSPGTWCVLATCSASRSWTT